MARDHLPRRGGHRGAEEGDAEIEPAKDEQQANGDREHGDGAAQAGAGGKGEAVAGVLQREQERQRSEAKAGHEAGGFVDTRSREGAGNR